MNLLLWIALIVAIVGFPVMVVRDVIKTNRELAQLNKKAAECVHAATEHTKALERLLATLEGRGHE